jgi:glucokinase
MRLFTLPSWDGGVARPATKIRDYRDTELRRTFQAAVGIDVGGTKIAAGVVDLDAGRVLDRRQLPTRPERGGAAVLADCAALADELAGGGMPVGIGLCELVGLDGRPASADTVDWLEVDVPGAFAAPLLTLESDVRAAARAEARFGGGRGRSAFLFVVVGTGASVCLVVDGVPFAGARGHAIVLGAPPVEAVASGRALARLSGHERAEDVLAEERYASLVDEAAVALGQTLAVLANALDPAVIVLGGGLGSDPGFCERVAAGLAPLVAYPSQPPLEVVPSQLGQDGGVVGAALSAAVEVAR